MRAALWDGPYDSRFTSYELLTRKKLPNGSFFLHFPITYDIINKLELCQAPNPSAGRVICPKEEVIS